jgi:peptide/nickel transport system ATP-binding protein
MTTLLRVRGLTIPINDRTNLVEDVNFEIKQGQSLALVGESGCGKSITALSLMRLLPAHIDRRLKGSLEFEGKDLLKLGRNEMRDIRGKRLSMVFQDPLSALNPVMTIGDQIAEVLLAHNSVSARDTRDRAIELMRLVRIPDPENRINEYPHRLSGGMRQRVTIAIALACNPALLIADEPTTALDVTVSAQILSLLDELRSTLGLAILFITHDFGVVKRIADSVAVMYSGRIVESGAVRNVLDEPRHRYTESLLASRPEGPGGRGLKLPEIQGMVPAPADRPHGCHFAPRCGATTQECTTRFPPVFQSGSGHDYRCYRPVEHVRQCLA